MEFTENALGRKVPLKVNGREKKTYREAYDPQYSEELAGRPGKASMHSGESKVTTLDEVMELIEDGDTISYPHYYRLGDRCLRIIVEKLREIGRKDIRILGNAFFDNCVPWLPEAIMDGTIGGISGSCYGGMGKYVMRGDFLPWTIFRYGHGNRVRRFHTGEEKVKVAFGPVPIADQWGNANGLKGDPSSWVGPLGLFLADSMWAENVCLLAGEVSERYLFPRSLSMVDVDYVVKVDNPGDSSGIGSGTIDINRIRENRFNSVIAQQVLDVMQAGEVIRDDFTFQVGAGAGLIVLDEIRKILREKGISSHFSIGGCTSLHVEMLHEGLIKNLLHGQCFQPSENVIKSMLNDPTHYEISTGEYDDVANKENAVNMLDVSVLTALEMDLNFNCNSICANGRILGGIGGAQGVAAGSELTIMFLPLATGKKEKNLGFPRIVEDVYTVSLPGEVIDVVVTDSHAAINPDSNSRYLDDIRKNAGEYGLNLVSMEELHELSVKKAAEFGKRPPRPEVTDEPVELIEWRDGTALDTIFKLAD
jgi:citrate lyase subunit alpha/citrate CoA-transferase